METNTISNIEPTQVAAEDLHRLPVGCLLQVDALDAFIRSDHVLRVNIPYIRREDMAVRPLADGIPVERTPDYPYIRVKRPPVHQLVFCRSAVGEPWEKMPDYRFSE